MIEYLSRYRELVIKLKEEKRILTKLYSITNQAQEKYQENQNNIECLNNEIKELENSIAQIINNKLDKVDRKSVV